MVVWERARQAPYPTSARVFLVLMQGALVGATLWATRGLVDGLVSAVRHRPAPGLVLWVLLLLGAGAADRLLPPLEAFVTGWVRRHAGFALQERVLAQTAVLPLEAL